MPNEQENTPVNNSQDATRPFENNTNAAEPSTANDTPNPSIAAPSEVEPPTSSLDDSQRGASSTFGQTSFNPQQNETSFNDVSAEPVATTPATAAFGAASTTSPNSTGLAVAPNKSKKRFVIGGVVAGVLALVIGGAVAAYTLWYQNPDKVIGDALANALSSESATTDTKLTVKNGEGSNLATYDMTLKTLNDLNDARVDIKLSSNAESMKFDVSGSLLLKNNEKLFIKIDKLKELLEKSGMQAYLGSSASVTSLIEKLDSNWVVITREEIEENTGSKDDASKCIEDAMKKLRTDDAYAKELRQLYQKYPLVGVKQKLGSKDGSLGYELEFKRENAVKFANGVNSTKFYADLKKCDDKVENLDGEEMFKEDKQADDGDAKVVVWIDRWSHQFTKLEVTGKSDDSTFNMTTNMQFDTPVTVKEPKNPITIDELKTDIEAIQQEMMQASEASFDASAAESMRLNDETNTRGTSRS